ncbi:MAG TPA: cytochrome b/b6 domain-containing protein, partial [bacterium]|nr:cytochrome b/b6 domain-containing protein [bacterium]
MRRRRGPSVERFSMAQRVEHFLLLLSFNVLALTGLPQKYASTGWGERLISALGGIDQTRLIHRTAAVVLMAQGLYHLVAMLATRRRSVQRHDMRVSLQDVRGMIADIRYLAGRARERPRFGRFDYRQKLEYWAVIWGTVIMAATGLIMWFPIVVTQWLPGVIIPAAR